MRVVFLNLSAELGGAERSLLDLLTSLRKHAPGWRPSLVTGAEGPLAEEARSLGVDARVVPLPSAAAGLGDSALKFRGRVAARVSLLARAPAAAIGAGLYVRRLSRALRELRPDLIHTNDNKSHLLAGFARPEGVPVVWHLRDFIGSRGFVRRALRVASHRSAGAIANSAAVRRDAQAVLGGLDIEVIYNAIDLDCFSPGAGDGRWLDELCHMPPAPDGAVRVGLVATFGRWKGQDLFLEAIERLSRQPLRPPARFYVVGGPIYATMGSQFSRAELAAMSARLGIADRVGFTGFTHDTASAYRALDVVVHASTQPEPFGRTIVEAMACSRAVVVSNSGGAQELFTHDVDAVGTRPGDATDLAAAIRSLAEDPERRQRLGERARRTAVERFSRDRLARELLASYERLTGRRRVIEP